MPNNPQMRIVDLRSDTVTRPTPEMYDAIANAPVGDDVLGDDPTVIELESLAARTVNKESALFVPSGTMANQIAIASQTRPGDAILLEQEAHILYYEVGAPGVLSGVVTWTLPSNHGVMMPEEVGRRAVAASIHTPGTTLLCVENTHNRAGGTIIPLATLKSYREVADRHSMRIHMDGARLFNACVALEIAAPEVTRFVDTVSFCLSKGLGSPVGSLLCGSAETISRAKLWRKRLGGGMRQAGILAACGVVSLKQMVSRLAEDHVRARHAAAAIREIDGFEVDLATVQTNMVLVATRQPAEDAQRALHEREVWCFPTGSHQLRLVFHADIDDAKTDRAIEAFRKISDI